MRAALALMTLCVASAVAGAATPVQEPAPADPRQNQKIERIVVEDAGSRIEEVRVGGQTQSITVQPAGRAPAYEMQPSDGARSRPDTHRDGSGPQRVWRVLNF